MDNKKKMLWGVVTVQAIALCLLIGVVYFNSNGNIDKFCGPLGFLKLDFSKTLKDSVSLNFDLKALEGKGPMLDIAIIGSGPAGLNAAIYGRRSNFATYVFHGEKPGGQLMDTSLVDNWAGCRHAWGKDIIASVTKHAQDLGAIFLPLTVERVNFRVWPFELYTSDNQKFYALTVIIATGSTVKLLGIPGEKELWAKGVEECAICVAPQFAGKEVVVVGGGDSAAEKALQLAKHVKHVTIFVRKDKMRAAPSMQDRLKEYPNISIEYGVQPQRILGERTVTGIEYKNGQGNLIKRPIDGVFIAIGHDPNSGIFKQFVTLDDHGYIKLNGRGFATSVPGVFAAGDVADPEIKQALFAAGNGSAAEIYAERFLDTIKVTPAVLAKLSRTVQVAAIELDEITTVQEFIDQVEDATDPIIVDFYTQPCPACDQLIPALAGIAGKYQHKLKVIKVNAGNHLFKDILEKYKIYRAPSILAFKDGSLVARYGAEVTSSNLQELADHLIGGDPV